MPTKSVLAAAPASAVLPAQDAVRAREFYESTLGLEVESSTPGYVFVQAGEGTRFLVYETSLKPTEATNLAFRVKDIRAAVAELRERGVKFEDYDFPGLKTVDGTADGGDMGLGAWFKDSEGNVLNLVQM
jgi:predicted enzyme related to lactoylglutathione lyase